MNIYRIFKQNWTYAGGTPGTPPPNINRNIHKVDTANVHYWRIKGERNYELTDWRGNVNAVISDRRAWLNNSYWGSDVVGATDYYSFGSEQQGRTFVAADTSIYLLGYNGKYNDNEVYGMGNLVDLGSRFYYSRTGQFISYDPFASKFPNKSGYSIAGNDVIRAIDKNGDSLSIVTLMGFDRDHSKLQLRDYYVDSKIADNIVDFVKDATDAFPQLSVNNIYRPFSSSSIKTSNTKAKELSRHQAGFAIDFNGINTLSSEQLKALNKIAAKYKLSPLRVQDKDKPHFDADPKEHGYKNLKAAVDEDKAHFDAIQKGTSQPVDYKKTKSDDNTDNTEKNK